MRSEDGNQTLFKVKPTTSLRKLLDAYLYKNGKSHHDLRFIHRGAALPPEASASLAESGMSDGDEIDTILAQIGQG